MDIRLINHSSQTQSPKGLCTLPPGRCQISPEAFLQIEDDPAFSDGRLEVIAQDAAELKKIREAIEAKAKQARSEPEIRAAFVEGVTRHMRDEGPVEAAPKPKRSSAKESKK